MARVSVAIPLALMAALLVQTAAASPIAEVICDTTPRLEQRLERAFLAERSATGIRSREQVMEVWTDRKGDWVLVSRHATGTSCIVAMGQHWQQADPAS